MAGNTRNGYGRKTVTTEPGRIELAIPRGRQATLDSQLIARYQRCFPSFDHEIVSISGDIERRLMSDDLPGSSEN